MSSKANLISEAIERHSSHNFASLSIVRAYLSNRGISARAEQDALLIASIYSGLISGSGHEGRHGITAQQRADALTLPDGSIRAYLSVRCGPVPFTVPCRAGVIN